MPLGARLAGLCGRRAVAAAAPHLRQAAARHLLPRARRLLAPPKLQVYLLLVPVLAGAGQGADRQETERRGRGEGRR